jgi:hypothetical protein
MQPATALRPPKARFNGRTVLTVSGVAVLFATIIGVLAWALRSPTYVDEVRVENDTTYEVSVDVTDADGSRLGLGTVPVAGRIELRDVLDRGDSWTFVYSFAGRDVGEVTVDRSQLEEGDWTVSVPPDVADRLERDGYRPSSP